MSAKKKQAAEAAEAEQNDATMMVSVRLPMELIERLDERRTRLVAELRVPISRSAAIRRLLDDALTPAAKVRR